MIKPYRWVVPLLFVASTSAATPAFAASFDCRKASTEVELAICGDPHLSRLDSELGTVYKARLAIDPDLRRSQIDWIRERNRRCGPDAACLARMVRERIDELGGLATSHMASAAHPQSLPVESKPGDGAPDSAAAGPIVEIPQLEPLDLDRIQRAEPSTQQPVDALAGLVASYFHADAGRIRCGEAGRSYRDFSDIASAYGIEATNVLEPRFRSHPLSAKERAAFSGWHACHMYATQQRWARLIPAISHTVCQRAAARVNEGDGGSAAQDELADLLSDLQSSCGAYAEHTEAGGQFMASVRRLADRTNLLATDAANRMLMQFGDQKRRQAEAAARQAEIAEEQRHQRELAESQRRAAAAARAEAERKNNAKLAEVQAARQQHAESEQKAKCAAVPKDDATINLIARQILDGNFEGGVCAESMFICQQLTRVAVNRCSLGPRSRVARCLVEEMHGCSEW